MASLDAKLMRFGYILCTNGTIRGLFFPLQSGGTGEQNQVSLVSK